MNGFSLSENSVKAVGVPRKFILNVISPFLRGLPAQTLRQLTIDQGSNANWDNFKELLLKFRSIICNLTGLKEDEKVYCFAEGLNSKTKFEVKSKQCKTLEEAIRVASIFESCCGKIMVGINSNKIYKSGQPYKKYQRNNFSLRKRISNRDEAKTGIKSFKCNKMDHIAKDCRSQKYKNKTVHVCKTSSDSILSIVGFVNGTPVKLALDSGAVESIISNKIVERLGLKIYESNVQVKTATDDVKKVLGETEEVNVEIEGHTCRMSFLVLDMEDYEVLLGLNWFEQTGAGIFPSEKILRFPVHTVRLLKDDSKYETFDDMVDVLLTEVVDEVDIENESYWETQELKFEPSIPLDGLHLKQFKSLMNKNRDMFALSIEDLGECAVREHIINFIDDSPIFLQPFRKSASERNEFQKEINKMLKARGIRPSKSAWSSPVIMYQRKMVLNVCV
ncbi:unnamed protein product [Brachionus calyciflorus]|uniref:Uncharacterized protein n=1 Tax=Brachionus calyciflorus TaxID=104777 RepID=A0A814HZR8_9BILA|nr:unnamed protein product [Brachionus calyciflorus]